MEALKVKLVGENDEVLEIGTINGTKYPAEMKWGHRTFERTRRDEDGARVYRFVDTSDCTEAEDVTDSPKARRPGTGR